MKRFLNNFQHFLRWNVECVYPHCVLEFTLAICDVFVLGSVGWRRFRTGKAIGNWATFWKNNFSFLLETQYLIITSSPESLDDDDRRWWGSVNIRIKKFYVLVKSPLFFAMKSSHILENRRRFNQQQQQHETKWRNRKEFLRSKITRKIIVLRVDVDRRLS